MTLKKKLNKSAIDSWPEVFKEVELNVVPIQYLSNVNVLFKDNKIWNIKIGNQLKDENWQTIEKNINELISNYESSIKSIDFQLDTDKIKIDVIKHTNNFLKRKLK
ncbi:MAG: hypothetical protein EBT86_11565 [Actinobacteria bacterium]|nr:hypothetical protein [Actinomycetota bacterium]NDC04146.1 hypothetical protein [Betaproteobacteria bacterium]NDC86836.1 hypothetical protein [Betaproteobacteria bacterium]